MTEKRQKNDNASRKIQFLPPAKLSFFCHVFVMFVSAIWLAVCCQSFEINLHQAFS
jgi:hypothetical protein